MKHKSVWILIVWLVFLIAAIGIQVFVNPQLPLADMVNLTGYISLAYVGLSKGANIIKAFRSPVGEFGFDYVPAYKDRMMWVTIVWILIVGEILVVRAIVRDAIVLPLQEAVIFSGALSAVFVGANKAEKIGAASGTEAGLPTSGTAVAAVPDKEGGV